MHRPLIYHLTRHFVLARVICWRIFTRKRQSKHGNFLFFSAGAKIFLLIINNLENISKIIAQILVYMIYTMYICTINLKQEQKWIIQQNKSKTLKELTTLC